MNSLELNKVFAAVLTAGITFMVAGQVGKILVHGEKPHESAILIGDPSGGAPAGGAPAAPAGPEPISGLLASADVEAGQQIAARNCGACHSFNQGGKAGIGPNLYGIVGAPHGHAEGFNYSAAIKGKAGPWNYDELNAWLYKPATYAPGTRMAYAGLANTQQRANVVAYLRSLSPNPAPLPPAGQPAAGRGPRRPDGHGRRALPRRRARPPPLRNWRRSARCSPPPMSRTAPPWPAAPAASATPSPRAAATASAPTSMTWSASRMATWTTSTTPRR